MILIIHDATGSVTGELVAARIAKETRAMLLWHNSVLFKIAPQLAAMDGNEHAVCYLGPNSAAQVPELRWQHPIMQIGRHACMLTDPDAWGGTGNVSTGETEPLSLAAMDLLKNAMAKHPQPTLALSAA